MLKEQLESIDNEIARLKRRRDSLIVLEPLLTILNFEWSICNEHIDFDNKIHSDVMQVLKHFGGKWDKTLGATEGTINYVRRDPIGEFTIRCWSAEPPPSCRIVEEVVEVAEQLVPAHTKTVRKLVCLELESANAED